ncbi:MAG: competence/damage-inducible protein A [Flammeovirgaceae bacterium]
MKPILAEIITIGDEILYGHIVDTNSQWLSAELDKAGIRTHRKIAISDREEEILAALGESASRADIIITTGGLGPTKDDITKYTFAKFFGVELTYRQEVMDNIASLFKARGRELNELNKAQADIPENGEVITNTIGTAAGMWFQKDGKVFVSMPGVPHEMKKMMAEVAIPRMQEVFHTPNIYHKMVKTIAVPESKLAHILEDWEANLPEQIKLAYLPRMGQVRLRLTAVGMDLDELKKLVDIEIGKLHPLIGKYIYAYDHEEVEHTVGKLLQAQGKKMASAESCTGGLIADKITNIPGCSAYFMGGIVAYSNEVKQHQLGVQEETLKIHGAVSEQTAKEMAENARIKYGADFGIATTGIAGPGGATPNKPVGTIWIGYSDEHETIAKHYQLTHDRMLNVNFTYNLAMNLLRRKLMGV